MEGMQPVLSMRSSAGWQHSHRIGKFSLPGSALANSHSWVAHWHIDTPG